MRTREEIACQILQSADEGATQMKLMYETYLSHDALRGHLKSLIDEGLLEYIEGDMKYRTMPAGRGRLLAETASTINCSHQCKKCGMIYLCGAVKCQNFFHYGICAGCDSSFVTLTAGLSPTSSITTDNPPVL